MSYAVRYHSLFRVRVRETGTDRDLPGIHCTPTRRTKQKMRNHGLVFKNLAPGFAVYFATNPDAGNTVFGPIRDPIVLSFAMLADSPATLAAYEPGAKSGLQAQFYLDNLLADGNLHPGTDSPMSTGPSVSSNDSARIYPHEFRLDAGDVAGADTLQIRELVSDRVALAAPIELDKSEVDLSGPAIDLRHALPGPFKVSPSPGTSRKIYVDDELARGRTLAALDLHWRTPQDPAASVATYCVSFKRKVS